jgi:hypothetical protein
MELLVIGNYIKGNKIKSVNFNWFLEENFRESNIDKVVINKEKGYEEEVIKYYKSVNGNIPNQIILINTSFSNVLAPYSTKEEQFCVPEVYAVINVKEK